MNEIDTSRDAVERYLGAYLARDVVDDKLHEIIRALLAEREDYKLRWEQSEACSTVINRLRAENAAWKSRFPAYVYRPQDECVALAEDSPK